MNRICFFADGKLIIEWIEKDLNIIFINSFIKELSSLYLNKKFTFKIRG
jgi:hypothetical protein